MIRNRSVLCGVILSTVAAVSTPVLAVDTDGDGVDDVRDVCCFTPAGVEVDELGRPIGDFDDDCDVDVDDFRSFQNNLTGPMELGCCHDQECDDGDPCTTDRCNVEAASCVFVEKANCGECELGPECAVELACDVPFAGSITTADQVNSACFCVTDGETVQVNVVESAGSDPGFGVNWRLVDANGSPTFSCGLISNTLSRTCGPLPVAGSPYHLEVQDVTKSHLGSYQASMQRLNAARACEETPLECAHAAALTIDHLLDVDLASFEVHDMELVRISVIKPLGSPPDFNPSWRLIDGAGNVPRSCGRATQTVELDCGPMPAAGNPYRVVVNDASYDSLGAYQVYVQSIGAVHACDPRTLECDETVVGSIDDPSQVDIYQFRAADGEQVRISVNELAGAGLNFGINWRLIDSFGYPVGGCGPFASTNRFSCGPLAVAGSPYAIQVQDGARNDVGTYAAHLQRLTAARSCDETALACGVPARGMLETVVDSDLWSFPVPEGESVRITVIPIAGVHLEPTWRLLDAGGNQAPSCGRFGTATPLDCPNLPAALGPYRIEVEDEFRDGTGEYELRVDFLTSGCP